MSNLNVILESLGSCDSSISNINNQLRLQSPSQSSEAKGSTHTQVTKMPEISIDTFSGEQQNWDSFFEIFNAVVLCNKDLAVQKLIYLKSYLVGEPLKLVESLSLIGTNLHVAINILKKRYENILATIFNHIQGLMDVSSLST